MSGSDDGHRHPRNLQGLLRFCIENTQDEDAPAGGATLAPMTDESGLHSPVSSAIDTSDSTSTASNLSGIDLARKNQDSALATLGLYRYFIPGDGNCMFRAIASQLRLDQRKYHPILRFAALDWMQQNADQLLAGGLLDDLSEVEETGKLGAWPSQAALVALANVLGINIAVIQGGDKGSIDIQHITPFETPATADQPGGIILAYLYNGHYDALVHEPNLPNPEYVRWYASFHEQYGRRLTRDTKGGSEPMYPDQSASSSTSDSELGRMYEEIAFKPKRKEPATSSVQGGRKKTELNVSLSPVVTEELGPSVASPAPSQPGEAARQGQGHGTQILSPVDAMDSEKQRGSPHTSPPSSTEPPPLKARENTLSPVDDIFDHMYVKTEPGNAEGLRASPARSTQAVSAELNEQSGQHIPIIHQRSVERTADVGSASGSPPARTVIRIIPIQFGGFKPVNYRETPVFQPGEEDPTPWRKKRPQGSPGNAEQPLDLTAMKIPVWHLHEEANVEARPQDVHIHRQPPTGRETIIPIRIADDQGQEVKVQRQNRETVIPIRLPEGDSVNVNVQSQDPSRPIPIQITHTVSTTSAQPRTMMKAPRFSQIKVKVERDAPPSTADAYSLGKENPEDLKEDAFQEIDPFDISEFLKPFKSRFDAEHLESLLRRDWFK